MTRPKFRPCPSCQASNQVSRKTCHACFGSLSTKKKLKEKIMTLDDQWAQAVLNSRNLSRIIDSACIAVRKLATLGCNPILFIGRKEKRKEKKWVADVITHLPPTPVTKNLLEKMQRAYEFILTKTEQRPESLAQERPESLARERPESLARERPESQVQERPESQVQERPESLTQERPESLAQERPESLAQERPESLAQARPESCVQESPKSHVQERPESQVQLRPESQVQECPESLAQERPESLAQERPESQVQERPESLVPERPEEESETLFILNLVPVSSPLSSTSLFPPFKPSHTSSPPLPCYQSSPQRKRKNISTSSYPPSSIPHRKKKKNAGRLIQEHPGSLANESPESRAQEHPESLAQKHPESFAQKRPESLVQEHPESLAQKHSESFVQKRPESLDQEHPESLAHECPQSLAQKHPKSLAQKHPESLAQEHPDRQRKRRIKSSSPPSSSFPYRKNKKACLGSPACFWIPQPALDLLPGSRQAFA
nr:retinitis pigmentosa 1-like 1 protein [Misgurnus anguillicaudatus]